MSGERHKAANKGESVFEMHRSDFMKTAWQAGLSLLLSLVIAGCGSSLPPEAEGRSIVHVWSGWTGYPEETFERTLQLFNRSQAEFWVVNTSTIEDDSRIIRALTAGRPMGWVGFGCGQRP